MGYYLTDSAAVHQKRTPSFERVPPTLRRSSICSGQETHTPVIFLQERGLRFNNPEIGRWINRDPLGDKCFYDQHLRRVALNVQQRGTSQGLHGWSLSIYAINAMKRITHELEHEARGPAYAFLMNDPIGKTDYLGLVSVACRCCWIARGAMGRRICEQQGVDWENDQNGGNAYQHCIIACAVAKGCGMQCARDGWDAREDSSTLSGQQDLANNQNGYNVASSGGDCMQGCENLWRNGGLSCSGGTTGGFWPCPPP